MTTDSAIVDSLKSLHWTDYIPDWFSGWFRSIWSPDVFRQNPVNPVTGLTPTCVRD
jgi:hypothetical protein